MGVLELGIDAEAASGLPRATDAVGDDLAVGEEPDLPMRAPDPWRTSQPVQSLQIRADSSREALELVLLNHESVKADFFHQVREGAADGFVSIGHVATCRCAAQIFQVGGPPQNAREDPEDWPAIVDGTSPLARGQVDGELYPLHGHVEQSAAGHRHNKRAHDVSRPTPFRLRKRTYHAVVAGVHWPVEDPAQNRIEVRGVKIQQVPLSSWHG
mmetsp:Transcript_158577/g.508739  ORF Transcript_158577/g.508739 Transcript_158577/m.508739 type:complete len:213 (-) Transcript_158577:149-787(-)